MFEALADLMQRARQARLLVRSPKELHATDMDVPTPDMGGWRSLSVSHPLY